MEATTGPLGWILGLWPFGRRVEPRCFDCVERPRSVGGRCVSCAIGGTIPEGPSRSLLVCTGPDTFICLRRP